MKTRLPQALTSMSTHDTDQAHGAHSGRARILVAEDDPATRTFLADNLVADGYDVVAAENLREAERAVAHRHPDLAILDLSLPDGDGLALLRDIRAGAGPAGAGDPGLPVLILSGRAAELDRLRGFERGADDFLVKPFSYPELRARVGALLWRVHRRPRPARLHVGPLVLDASSRSAWVRGEPVALSNKEFALVRALATEPTRVFTREELLRDVWGFASIGRTRTLDSHASRLRLKLGAHGDRFLVNVWGVGYRLIDGEG